MESAAEVGKVEVTPQCQVMVVVVIEIVQRIETLQAACLMTHKGIGKSV